MFVKCLPTMLSNNLKPLLRENSPCLLEYWENWLKHQLSLVSLTHSQQAGGNKELLFHSSIYRQDSDSLYAAQCPASSVHRTVTKWNCLSQRIGRTIQWRNWPYMSLQLASITMAILYFSAFHIGHMRTLTVQVIADQLGSLAVGGILNPGSELEHYVDSSSIFGRPVANFFWPSRT